MKQRAEEQKDRDGKNFEQRLSSRVREVHSRAGLLPSNGNGLPIMAIGRKTPLPFDHLDTLDKVARVDALDSSNFKLARVHCIE